MSKKENLIEITESAEGGGPVVKVHKAFPGKVDAIKRDLQKSHSDNGKPLHSSEHGDYVHIHLPKKEYNNKESVSKTLKDHEGHPAYGGHSNIHEASEVIKNIISKDQPRIDEAKAQIKAMLSERSAQFISDSSKFIAKSLFQKG